MRLLAGDDFPGDRDYFSQRGFGVSDGGSIPPAFNFQPKEVDAPVKPNICGCGVFRRGHGVGRFLGVRIAEPAEQPCPAIKDVPIKAF